MAKKKKKKEAAPTACEQGGPELLPVEVRIRQGEVVTFTIHVCRTNADVDASLQAIPNGAVQQLFATSGQAVSRADLPTLPVGRYALFWSILTAATPWQTRADLVVSGTTRFLRRKSNASAHPVNMGFLIIEVV
jgi:hypothetical protein